MQRISIFLLAFFIALPLWSDEVVVKKDGKTYQGKIEYKKNYLKMRTSRGLKTFKWKEIQTFQEFPLHSISSSEKREDLEKLYEKKSQSVQGRGAVDFFQLGEWCKRKGLIEEANQAFEKVIQLNPDHQGARKHLGYLKEDGKWKKLSALFQERFEKLNPKNLESFYPLIQWCEKWELYDEAEKLVRILLRKNNYNRKAIGIFRRLTARYQPKRSYVMPLKGRFKVVVDHTKHHQMKCFAIWAYDIVKINENGYIGEKYKKLNSDYYVWNEPVYSVGDGVVKYTIDKFKDNKPGSTAPFYEANKILIDHGGGEYSFYCHLKKSSSKVKVGDKVKKGQMIGRVGNSGASGMPHLHFTMMDSDYFSIPIWVEDYAIELKSEKVEVKIARPQEGWIVESRFKKYFLETAKSITPP